MILPDIHCSLGPAAVSSEDDTVFTFPHKFAPLAISRRSYGRFVPSACSKIRHISLTSADDAYALAHAAATDSSWLVPA